MAKHGETMRNANVSWVPVVPVVPVPAVPADQSPIQCENLRLTCGSLE